MGYLLGDGKILPAWILEEVELETPLKKGALGQATRRVQEWLNLHNIGLGIDGDFGQITELKVKQFQEYHGFQPTGIVDAETFKKLVAPLRRVLTPIHINSKGK